MRFKKQFLSLFFLFKVLAILNQQTVLNTNVSLSSFSFSFFSFLYTFFLLLEKVSKSTHSFTVDETNLFSLFHSFSEYIYIYIYNFQYLGRVEGKTVLRCTYLFEGFTSHIPFSCTWVTSLQNRLGQPFCWLLSKDSVLCFLLGFSELRAVDRRLCPPTSVLKLKSLFQISSDKKVLFSALKTSANHLASFFSSSLFHSGYYNDLHSLLCPTNYRLWSAGSLTCILTV